MGLFDAVENELINQHYGLPRRQQPVPFNGDPRAFRADPNTAFQLRRQQIAMMRQRQHQIEIERRRQAMLEAQMRAQQQEDSEAVMQLFGYQPVQVQHPPNILIGYLAGSVVPQVPEPVSDQFVQPPLPQAVPTATMASKIKAELDEQYEQAPNFTRDGLKKVEGVEID